MSAPSPAFCTVGGVLDVARKMMKSGASTLSNRVGVPCVTFPHKFGKKPEPPRLIGFEGLASFFLLHVSFALCFAVFHDKS